MDTMSMHTCVSGVTSYQRTVLKAKNKEPNPSDEDWMESSSLNNLSEVTEASKWTLEWFECVPRWAPQLENHWKDIVAFFIFLHHSVVFANSKPTTTHYTKIVWVLKRDALHYVKIGYLTKKQSSPSEKYFLFYFVNKITKSMWFEISCDVTRQYIFFLLFKDDKKLKICFLTICLQSV